MKAPDPLGIITGLIFMVIGIILIIVGAFFLWFLIIYGALALVVGLVILLTLRSQEQVEKIKG